MGRKRRYTPRSHETIGTKNLSATLFASMLQSQAYFELSSNAKVLYQYMKLQLYGQKEKPQGNQDYFVFNKAMYTQTYPIFKNGEQFNKYCHELIKNGFIEEVENGHNTRTKNIYKYSDMWKSWEPGLDFRPLAMRIHDEELKAKRSMQATRKPQANRKTQAKRKAQ